MADSVMLKTWHDKGREDALTAKPERAELLAKNLHSADKAACIKAYRAGYAEGLKQKQS